jgi:L-arabinokinase
MAIVFYISGHGFGHASRQVEIINALGARTHEPLIIRSDASPRLLDRTLRVPCAVWPGPCDTGVIQQSSVAQDDEATVLAALDFYTGFEARVDAERQALEAAGARLIVADVPPLACAVARRLGVPAVAISNFTWDWIYETHPGFLPQGRAVLDTIRAAYAGTALALELPFAGGFEVFPRVRPIPLVARRASHDRDATRAHFGLPAAGHVALLSFGGYGLPGLDHAAMDWSDAWTVVTTDRITAGGPIRVLGDESFPAGPFRYEDLVAAVDVVMTKPGYGIVSECISTGTAMVYTERGSFREYDTFVHEMPQVLRCQFISQADLFAGRWRAALEAAIAQPPPPVQMPATGADVAAEILLAQ